MAAPLFLTVTRFGLKRAGWGIAAGTLLLQGGPVGGQVPTAEISPEHGQAATNRVVRQIAVKPVSPVAYFRELLAMSPAEQARALADKPAERQQTLRAKLQEYEAMTPEERELRLRLTEIRWLLIPLMKMTSVERTVPLAGMPAWDREMIERRLKVWDSLPLHLQKHFLKNDNILSYLVRIESTTPAQRAIFLKTFTEEERHKVEAGLGEWNQLPAEQRQQLCESFGKFFELDETERARTLGTLSTAEQAQMEKALQKYEKLPLGQRRRCLESFQKFAGMNDEERNQFLKNAERWQAMAPSERQAWREIVLKTPALLPPPLPPLMPPMPKLPGSGQKFMVSTNQSH